MAGGSGPRNVNSRYQRAREDADVGENSSDGRRQRARSSGSGSGTGSRRGRPPLGRPRDVPEEELRTSDSSEDEQARATDNEGDAQEGGEAGGSSTAAARPYLRGPSKLPGPPLPPLRPVIRPQGDRHWQVVSPGDSRNPNHILGLVCRHYYPDIVTHKGTMGPAKSWDHYKSAPDADYENKQERVRREFWTFFRCEEGQEERAEKILVKSARKRISDMHYEERLTCIIKYYATRLGQKITKPQARQMSLTREQFLEMIPWWCESYRDCWEMIVDKWFTEVYIQEHEAHRERALQATGPTHHQGSRSLAAYKKAWSASHGGQSLSTFMAYGLARKGKAASDVTFSPDDPPESYSNSSAYTRISSYASEARSVQGPEWDPNIDDIDGPTVMRIGQGKKHGRYWLGDGTLESGSVPTLSQIRAETPTGGSVIHQRPSPSQQRVDALQAENERMAQELRDLVARTEQAEREREAERAERERQAKQLAEITAFLQHFGQVNGVPVPQFALLPPVLSSPPPSAGSNNPSQGQAGDGAFASPGTQFPPQL